MLQHLARAVLLRYKSHLFTPVFSSYLTHLRTTNLTHGDPYDLGLVLSASVCVFLIMQSSSQFLKVAGFTYAVSSAQNLSHLGLPAKYPQPPQTHTHLAQWTPQIQHPGRILSMPSPDRGSCPVLTYLLNFSFTALILVVSFLYILCFLEFTSSIQVGSLSLLMYSQQCLLHGRFLINTY